MHLFDDFDYVKMKNLCKSGAIKPIKRQMTNQEKWEGVDMKNCLTTDKVKDPSTKMNKAYEQLHH